MRFIASKQQLENEISEVFKPFISYSKKTSEDNNFYTYYFNSNEIRYYHTIKNTTLKTYETIMSGNTKNDLLNKIRAIKKYLYETELKRIEV